MNKFAATIGNFDGVHLGHQELIGKIKQTASKNNLPPNKFMVKMITMSSRGLIVIVLIGAAIAFN